MFIFSVPWEVNRTAVTGMEISNLRNPVIVVYLLYELDVHNVTKSRARVRTHSQNIQQNWIAVQTLS